MSTRAGIIITDGNSEAHFYKHSDGYPDGTMPMLERFINLVKTKKIRDNTGQAAGWLTIIGHEEYLSDNIGTTTLLSLEHNDVPKNSYNLWKVGAFEFTSDVKNHGDLEYIYIVNLESLTIEVEEV